MKLRAGTRKSPLAMAQTYMSAFTQQRSKVLPEAFEYLFKSFTDDNLQTTNNYHG